MWGESTMLLIAVILSDKNFVIAFNVVSFRPRLHIKCKRIFPAN